MRTATAGTMLPYWAGLLAGLFGSTVAACYLNGCGGTMMGSIAFVLVLTLVSGLGESVFLIGGLESWRHRVREARWPGPFLFIVGLIVGSAAPVIAIALVMKTPQLQNFFQTYLIALSVFVFGPPVFSCLAIYLLSRAGRRGDEPTHPSDEVSP